MIVELIYDCLFFIPLAVTLSSFLHRYIERTPTEAAWLVITLLTATFLMLLKHLKIKGKAVTSGILLAFMLAVWVFMPSGERLDLIKDHIFILWEILLTAGCLLICEVSSHYRMIRFVLSISGFAVLIISLIRKTEVTKISVCMIFIFMLVTAADEYQRRSRKEGDVNPQKHLSAISPFILVSFVLIMFIHIPDEPYDWGFVKKISQIVKSQYIMVSENILGKNGWDTDSPVIGFSDRSEPGGDLTHSERTVIKLITYSQNDPKVYLIGKTFDTFDGHSWDKNDDSKSQERLMDTLETLCAAMDTVGDEPLNNLVKRASMTFEYKDMHTLCFFAPEKYIAVRGDLDGTKIIGGDYTFVNRRSSRLPYEATYYRVNRDSEIFEILANTPHTVSETSWEKAKKESVLKEEISYEDYLAYHKDIYDTYLTDPVLSKDMQIYMDKVLLGAETDYEKLCRLEEMFEDFNYTEHPGDLPDSIRNESDFLDYFILEKKEGYCTYYASAFVILSRYCGIPARYVQGFRVPVGKTRDIDVSSNYAHAWPEAYLDGIGWFVFEPTPGMRTKVSWELTGKAGKPSDLETTPYIPNGRVDVEITDGGEGEGKRFRFHWYMIAMPVVAGLAFTLLVFAIDRLIKEKRYRKMDERGKAQWICKNCLDFLKRKKLGRNDKETLTEYHERLKEILSEDHLEFIGTYEDILYSDRQISMDERKELERSYVSLKKAFRSAR